MKVKQGRPATNGVGLLRPVTVFSVQPVTRDEFERILKMAKRRRVRAASRLAELCGRQFGEVLYRGRGRSRRAVFDKIKAPRPVAETRLTRRVRPTRNRCAATGPARIRRDCRCDFRRLTLASDFASIGRCRLKLK